VLSTTYVEITRLSAKAFRPQNLSKRVLGVVTTGEMDSLVVG